MMQLLSLFVEHQFRISAIAPVCAYQNEILVGKNTETAVTACFKLIPEIGGLVVEESGFHTTWKWVLEIYITAYQCVQFCQFRHAFYLQTVDFFYQLFLEGLELAVIAQF